MPADGTQPRSGSRGGGSLGLRSIIDSYGGTSRQQDVVVYERDICPVFSVNRTPQTTYYPCEGVVAVGEIKSWLDGNSLQDAIQKVASAKGLRRHVVTDRMPHPTTGEPIPLKRNYLSQRGDSVVRLDEGPEQKERAQIFGFVLAGESRLSREKLVATFSGATATGMDERLLPNLLVTLDGHAVRWGKIAKGERKEVRKSSEGTYGLTVHKDGPETWQESWSAETATHAGGSERPDPFRMLVRWIRQGAELGRTSDVESFDILRRSPRGRQCPSSLFRKGHRLGRAITSGARCRIRLHRRSAAPRWQRQVIANHEGARFTNPLR